MTDHAAAWTRLHAAAADARETSIEACFSDEPARLSRLTLDAAGLHLDLSKQAWTLAGVDAGLELARAAGVEAARERLFSGEVVNPSEGRAALHTALRAQAGASPVSTQVDASRAALKAFVEGVRTGRIAAADGHAFHSVLHIGVGGSDLGPRLLWEALKPLRPVIDVRFVSNIDGADIAQTLAGLDPNRTLVMVVSKTFSTEETMANAKAARAWLTEALGAAEAGANLAAVSADLAAARAFGISDQRVFGLWDWVGGRYSLWSAVGLSCAIGLGWDVFERLLAGAWAMDRHFVEAPLERNAPVLLALSHVFNRNGLHRPARAVIPYAQRLALLPAHLQQLEMESNGKQVTADGRPAPEPTAGVVFGQPGTNGQHAFFQLLHQGTDIVPVDFVAVARADEGPDGRQAMLLANCLAQAEALMLGRNAERPERRLPGNRPSNLILMERLGPEALGALLALYEHKTFVEGVLWEINSFDQWGVEFGKSLAARILGELHGEPAHYHDPSTTALIARLKL